MATTSGGTASFGTAARKAPAVWAGDKDGRDKDGHFGRGKADRSA